MGKDLKTLEAIERYLEQEQENLCIEFKNYYEDVFLDCLYDRTKHEGIKGLISKNEADELCDKIRELKSQFKMFNLFEEFNIFDVIFNMSPDVYANCIYNQEKTLVKDFEYRVKDTKSLLLFVYDTVAEKFEIDNGPGYESYKAEIAGHIFKTFQDYIDEVYKNNVEKLIIQNISPKKVINMYIDYSSQQVDSDVNESRFKDHFIRDLVVREGQYMSLLLMHLYDIDKWFWNSEEEVLSDLTELFEIAEDLIKNKGVAEHTYNEGYYDGLAQSLIDSQSEVYITAQRLILRQKSSYFSFETNEKKILSIVREKIKKAVLSKFDEFSFDYSIILDIFLDKVVKMNREIILKIANSN